MVAKRTSGQKRELNELTRDHAPAGAILFGLDGYAVEMLGAATEALRGPMFDRTNLQVQPNRLSTDDRFAETTRDGSTRVRTRSKDRLAKVSRTVADIIGSDTVKLAQLEKAAKLRRSAVSQVGFWATYLPA